MRVSETDGSPLEVRRLSAGYRPRFSDFTADEQGVSIGSLSSTLNKFNVIYYNLDSGCGYCINNIKEQSYVFSGTALSFLSLSV